MHRIVTNQFIHIPIEERIPIWKTDSATNEKGCWLFRHGLTHGYAQRSYEGSTRRLHILVWEHVNDCELPTGKHLHHECRNRNCWNPEHLKLLTPKEHADVHGDKGKFQSSKTHCPQGHKYTPENTHVYKGTTHRRCQTCHKEREMTTHRRKMQTIDIRSFTCIVCGSSFQKSIIAKSRTCSYPCRGKLGAR